MVMPLTKGIIACLTVLAVTDGKVLQAPDRTVLGLIQVVMEATKDD